jgi:bacillithiol system protein YtxJ
MIRDLEHEGDLEALLQRSHGTPVFLLKHSTRCPISAAAWREYRQFGESSPPAELWRVLVIEKKPLSGKVAHETGIAHQSPQLLLISDGRAIWHVSHWSITQEAMANALEDVAGLP